MPQVEPGTPVANTKISGVAVSLPLAYAAGHVLTAPEASFLSRKVITAIGNTVAHKLTGALEAAVKATKKGDPTPTLASLGIDIQAEASATFAAFQPGVSQRGTGAATGTDPIAKLAHFLASQAVESLIRAKGLKPADFRKAKGADGKTSKLSEMTVKYLGLHPELHDQAAAQLASAPSDDGDIFDVEEVQAAA